VAGGRMAAVGAIEHAIRAEIATLAEPVRTSGLATVAIELARRLDGGPGNDSTVRLARELRQAITALQDCNPKIAGDVDAVLDRIAAPHLRHSSN
jgi:hypothetical protein